MDAETFDFLKDLEVVPLGENGEMEILPISSKNRLNTSKLPCGLPPILPDTKAMLNSFLDDPNKLPILHLDAVQRLVPTKPNISSLYSIDLCPLPTTLNVKRDMTTGKLLGFSEELKDIFEGTHKTSTSLTRTPGPSDAGIRGSSSSFPFWPGGMDEPWADLLRKDTLDTSIFDEDFLDTPPGFKCGMKFEKKNYHEADYVHSQPQKIYLSDVLAMEDAIDLEMLNDPEEKTEQVELEKIPVKEEGSESEDAFLKLISAPVINISGEAPKTKAPEYEWAVIEDAHHPVEDFKERIPQMAKEFKFPLDPFQQRAILHLEKKESVFVAAHTSSGKTVVAEYAIALAQKNVSRVIYTSPVKALSNQKYRDFKKELKIDVGLITGDVQKNPKAFCLIMTTEILRSMLYHGSDVVRELEWVIFDEVHYINDTERGVVWEEVFIMLPDHVNLIMLSATVPNTAEFADWLGGIKKKKIYVISTLKRPIPLEHYLYTGSVGISQNDIFKIVDATEKFLDNKYTEALTVKKDREGKSRPATGPKGPRYNIKSAQEKNVYIGLLGHLDKKELLPAICFTLSRRRCNQYAQMLESQDLIKSNKKKNEIQKFFTHSISNLKEEDKKLPQVASMRKQLLRGFGIHHSGILPILKEVVEMLFQRGLVKVLFATETFAMGVNMPARTVIFDSIRKHDGIEFRDLRPSEYIQMAGRAGRRGSDKTGIVIIICKADIPEASTLKGVMLGKPTKLESQFKLTYSMILNLLKIKTLRVEDVMKRSFIECDKQKQEKICKEQLIETKKQLASYKRLECSLCNVDLDCYLSSLADIKELKQEVMAKKCSQAVSSKVMVPGRILVISTKRQQNILCLLLSMDKDQNCKVLAIGEKGKFLDAKVLPDVEEEVLPLTQSLFYPSKRQPEILTITFTDIEIIGNRVLKIDDNAILKECKRLQTMSSNPGHSTSSAFQELCSLCEANLKGFPSQNINLKDIDSALKAKDLEKEIKTLENYTCVKCPEFSKHITELSSFKKLEGSAKKYQYQLSEESLLQKPDYESRKKVLEELEYIDKEENVQLKGSVAREMSNHELLLTELLVKSTFSDCEPEEVAALLSCMVFQQKSEEENLELPSHLLEKIKEIRSVAIDISLVQSKCGVVDPDFVSQYNFQLVPVVYDWAKGITFAEIMKKTDIDEGIIVRSIQRLSELLKDVRNSASLVGDTTLATKMIAASEKIKRDIVFAASLYTIDEKEDKN